MLASDPQTSAGRYDDLTGPNTEAVLSALDWCYTELPMTLGVFVENGSIAAIAFATPVRLKSSFALAKRKARSAQIDGVNLSYAVHSEHEGKGYGLLACALVMYQAGKTWSRELESAFFNIQTRAGNARSQALMSKLSGALCSNAAFEAYPPSGEPIAFVGTRSPWPEALARTQRHLVAMGWADDPGQDDIEPLHSPSFP